MPLEGGVVELTSDIVSLENAVVGMADIPFPERLLRFHN